MTTYTALAVRFSMDDDGIAVRSPYALREIHRQLSRGRWDTEGRVWRYPAMPAIAGMLAEAFASVPSSRVPRYHISVHGPPTNCT